MKKIIICTIAPALVYLIWFVYNVKSLAVQHLDLQIDYPLAFCFVSIIFFIIFKIIYKIKKDLDRRFLLIPKIYLGIGILTLIIGYWTPCCSGG